MSVVTNKMTITRLDEDRYVISFDGAMTAEGLDMIRHAWKTWITDYSAIGLPGAMFMGMPVEYCDVRKTDLEKRLAELEAAIIHHKHS
jgi:hypothetical protein